MGEKTISTSILESDKLSVTIMHQQTQIRLGVKSLSSHPNKSQRKQKQQGKDENFDADQTIIKRIFFYISDNCVNHHHTPNFFRCT